MTTDLVMLDWYQQTGHLLVAQLPLVPLVQPSPQKIAAQIIDVDEEE